MSDKNLLYTFTQGRARLLAMAQRLLRSDGDAEDALQENGREVAVRTEKVIWKDIKLLTSAK